MHLVKRPFLHAFHVCISGPQCMCNGCISFQLSHMNSDLLRNWIKCTISPDGPELLTKCQSPFQLMSHLCCEQWDMQTNRPSLPRAKTQSFLERALDMQVHLSRLLWVLEYFKISTDSYLILVMYYIPANRKRSQNCS